MGESSGKIAATFVSCSFDITLHDGSWLRLHIQCHVGENELLMYRRHPEKPRWLRGVSGAHKLEIYGCHFPLLRLDNKKSVLVLLLSSCGFVHLEPGVFIEANETNKAHLHVKASEEGVHAPLGQEHLEERSILWETLAQQLGQAVARL